MRPGSSQSFYSTQRTTTGATFAKKFRKKIEKGSFEFGIVPSCSVRDAIQLCVIQVEINISPNRFAYPASNNGVDVIVLGAVSRPVTTTVKY